MSDLQRVRSRPGVIERHLGSVAALVALALAVVIVKPWGGGADRGLAVWPSPAAPAATAGASPARSHPADLGFGDLVYDPQIFGSREPPPAWDLRPAAFLVTFGFVFEVTATEPPSPPATVPDTPSPDGGPSWPARIAVPSGYHLFLFGIDMPRGYRLRAATLVQGGGERLVTRLLDSPWPAHFAVLGVPSGDDPNRLLVWTPGEYRLDLAFDPGAIERSLEIAIGA